MCVCVCVCVWGLGGVLELEGLGRVEGRGLDKFSGDGTNRINNNWSKLRQLYAS